MKDGTQDRHGSPPAEATAGETVYLAIGTLGRLHGINGEIVFHILTDFPERIKSRMRVYIGDEHQPQRIHSRRQHGKDLLLTFEGIRSAEAAEVLRNQMVFVTGEDRPPLEEGEYYFHEVIGLQVIDEAGLPLGNIVEILATGANDVYIVRRESGPDLLLPAIEDVILGIDLENRQMRVHLLPGLVE